MDDLVNHPKHYTKFCGKCKQELSIDSFAKNKVKRDGLQERCTPCRKRHHQEKGKFTKQKPTKDQKRKYLIRSYGLTVEEFERLYSKQNGRCALLS